MRNEIEDRLHKLLNTRHNMCNHLGVLWQYAMQCLDIVEFGVQNGRSSTLFLSIPHIRLHSWDLTITDEAEKLHALRPDWDLHQGSSVGAKTPESFDMLFSDTDHNGILLGQELEAHGNKAQKYIVVHDTEIRGEYGNNKYGDNPTYRTDLPGLNSAIGKFLSNNSNWTKEMVCKDPYGMTVLRRKK